MKWQNILAIALIFLFTIFLIETKGLTIEKVAENEVFVVHRYTFYPDK